MSAEGLKTAGETSRAARTAASQGLSPRELEVIKCLDSRSFGFLDLGKTSSASSGPHAHPGIISRDLLQQGITTLREELASGPPTDAFRGETFCQLGHLHLLLEEHTQALSAYQQYQTLCPSSSAMNANFHYGVGLIYFHLKSYNWAMEAFRKVLILSPNFARANEIHLRLGVMCKMKGDYMSSLEHLQEAACTPGPTSLGRLEIQFHIGHLHHLKGQHLAAKRVYEGILATQAIPNSIKAMALRQLGWLYHTAPSVCSPSEDSNSKALELLKLAVGADPSSGQTWYFLGRCHSAQGRAHEAFMAYQQSVNKSEDDQADTWCSIGVLYHNMNQPRDSLQAYLCAAYLDSCSTPAWSNLGCLYEAVAQPIDALICYKNAIVAAQKAPGKNKSMEYTLSRISSLERYIRTLGTTLLGQPRAIPSVHESWNSLIPSHIRKRHPRPDTPLLHLPGFPSSGLPTPHPLPSFFSLGNAPSNRLPGHVPKRPRTNKTKDPIILKSMSERWLSPGIRSPLTPSFSATTFAFPGVSPVSQTPFLPGMTHGNGIGHAVPDMKSPDLRPGSLTTQSLPVALDSTRNLGPFGMTTGPSPDGMGIEAGVDPLGIGLDAPLTQDGSLLGGIQASQTFSLPDNLSTMVDTLASSGGFPLNPSSNTLPSRTGVSTSRGGSLPTSSSATSHPFGDAGLVSSSLTEAFHPPISDGVLSASNGHPQPMGRPIDLALLPQKRSSSEFPVPGRPLSATSTHFTGDLFTHFSSPLSPANSVGERPLAMPSGRWAKHPNDTAFENSPMTPSSVGPRVQRVGSADSSGFSTGSTSVLPGSPASTSNGSYSIASLPRRPYSQNRISPLGSNALSSKRPRKLSESSVNSRAPPNVNPFSRGTFDTAVKMGDLLQHASVYKTQEAPPFHTTSTLPGESHFKTVPSHTRAAKSSVSDGLGQPLGTDLPGDLNVVSPLNFDSGMDEYLDHFLNGSQSQVALGLHDPGRKTSVESQASEHPHVSVSTPGLNSLFANAGSRQEERVPLFSPPGNAVLTPSGTGSWITAQSPRLLLSPRQEVQVLKIPNGRVSPHDSESFHAAPSPQQPVTPGRDRFIASSAKRPTSLSPRPPQEDNRLPDPLLSPHKSPSEDDTPTRERDSGIGETTAVSETVSDSSSVFSSREAKLSTSSPDPSPNPAFASPRPSPLTFTPSPLATSTHFGYPYPLPGEAGDDWSPTPSPSGRVSPIPEPHPSLGEEGEYMLQDPELRPPDPPTHTDDVVLNPKVPIYPVSGAKDAMSSTLHSFCSRPSQHICMIRGIAEALDLDLELFTTKKLVKACSNHMIEVREQVPQAADENWDPSGRSLAWLCESNRSFTTISEYGRYQNRILLNKEDYSTQSDYSDSASDSTAERRGPRKLLRFGTNVDLSDEHKWSKQLKELEKLPSFLQVSCIGGNLLSHIGHTILGMNSVQLYMKVPGSRTPGHQENNNFCSVNINIGPGDCEWFAVPNKYWGVIHDLCEKNKLSFLVGSWWPILDELRERKVPVYRFTQYKGDLVWINPGTVHWVQANNVCNNIAWNLGPLTAHQFRMSWERYQWNKIQRVHSIVPMVHLTWNLVKNVKIRNETLYKQIRTLLESSLQQTHRLLSQLKRATIPVHWHGRMEGESAPYCQNCLEEVFNILFVQSHRGEYIVYCHKCAASMRKNFTVLRQYSTEELEETLTSFKLYPREKAKKH